MIERTLDEEEEVEEEEAVQTVTMNVRTLRLLASKPEVCRVHHLFFLLLFICLHGVQEQCFLCNFQGRVHTHKP